MFVKIYGECHGEILFSSDAEVDNSPCTVGLDVMRNFTQAQEGRACACEPVRFQLRIVIIGLTFDAILRRQITCAHAVNVTLCGVELFTSIIIVLALISAAITNLLVSGI